MFGNSAINFIIYITHILNLVVNSAARNGEGNGWFYSQQQYESQSICPPNFQCLPSSFCQSHGNVYEYGNQYYTNRYGAITCGNEESNLVCCSQNVNNINTNTNRGRICGATLVGDDGYVNLGTFPFVARIGFRDKDTGEMKYPCSGSIIAERIVLTAAHCALAKSKNFKLYMVRVGEFDTNSEIDCGNEFCALPLQDITVSHVIVHPGYQQQSFKDDIALIVLNARIKSTVTSQKVCLPDPWSVIGNYGIVVGWGKVSGQTENHPRQQAMQLPIVNLQQCTRIYGETLPITGNQICAGGERKRDVCAGFGGSPLLEKQGGLYYQVGIMSFGSEQCGNVGVPNVYTNIRNYVTWIENNIPVTIN